MWMPHKKKKMNSWGNKAHKPTKNGPRGKGGGGGGGVECKEEYVLEHAIEKQGEDRATE